MVIKNQLDRLGPLWVRIKSYFSNSRKRSLVLAIIGVIVSLNVIAFAVFFTLKPKSIEKSKASEEKSLVGKGLIKPGEFIPGEVIVKFKQKVNPKLSSGRVKSQSKIEDKSLTLSDFDSSSIPKVVVSLSKKYKVTNFSKVVPEVSAKFQSVQINQTKEPLPDLDKLYLIKIQLDVSKDSVVPKIPTNPQSLEPGSKITVPSPEDTKNAQESAQTLKIIDELKKDPSIEYATPNYKVAILKVPNDPYFSSNSIWGGNPKDMWGLNKINAAGAWDTTTGSDTVVVADVDTGIDYTHEDIKENIWINWAEVKKQVSQIKDVDRDGKITCVDLFDASNAIANGVDDDGNGYIDDFCGWDFANNDNNPMDDNGHGTHTAGTIAAVGNNALGVVGMSWKAKIMALKFLDAKGSGSVDKGVTALKYAADNKAKVNNNSWGGPAVEAEHDAIKYASSKGIIIISAAGNDNSSDPNYPAGYEESMAIAATDYQDQKAWFSNWGIKVDVAAPGVDVLSLRAKNTDVYGDGKHIVGEKYYYASGTSMATPHVAGLTALLISKFPSDSPYDITSRIIVSADELSSDPEHLLGSGRINAYKALTLGVKPFIKLLSVDMEEYNNSNNNGTPDPGENVKIIVKIENVWKNASSVKLILTTPGGKDSYVIDSTSNFGSLSQNQIKDNTNDPIIIHLGEQGEFERIIDTTLSFNSDGSVQNYQKQLRYGLTRITTDSACVGGGYYWKPIVSNNKVSWNDSRDSGNVAIYYADLNTRQETKLPTGKSGCYTPIIYNNLIAYTCDNGNDLYVYDLSTSKSRYLERLPYGYGSLIVMDGNNLGISDYLNSTTLDVAVFDLSTGIKRYIATSALVEEFVQALYKNKLVYSELNSGLTMYNDLYYYDLNTNQNKLFSSNGNFPFINQDKIVYMNLDDSDIYLYDTNNHTNERITTDGKNKYSPVINDNFIAWSTTYGIFVYDLNTKKTKEVTFHSDSYALSPFISSDNKLLWIDNRRKKTVPGLSYACSDIYIVNLKKDTLPTPTSSPTPTKTPTPKPTPTKTPTPTTGFSNLSATLSYPSPASFKFSYGGYSSRYAVYLSTYADMSWDTYLDFATGVSSPLTVTNPTKWDKYSCNRTLYWKVRTQEGVESSIQTTKVSCGVTPTPTPKPTPTRTPTPKPKTPTPTPISGFSNLSATLSYPSPASFKFSYGGYSSHYAVYLSTYADMSWDTYLDFATGVSSPLTVTNPTKWDKYSCNRTLYWKVRTQEGVESSIQATKVNCGE